MALSNSISTYGDVHRVLQTAVQHGGGSYRLPTPGAAKHFRMRANHYRSLLHREQRANQTVLRPTETEFDALIFRLDADDPCTVIITTELVGEFISPSGEVVAVAEPVQNQSPALSSIPDDLEMSARDFAKLLGELDE